MQRRYAIFPVLFTLLLLPAVHAQTTFAVTVISNTADNPRPNPWPVVYAIDGAESAALTLTRGQTYVFEIGAGANSHPFYISTSDVGGGAGVWSEGVTGNFATTGGTVTFTVPASAPDLLYYECGNHPRMGWQLNIVNATSSEEEAQPSALTLDAAFPNPFAEATTLTLTLASPQLVTVDVFSTTGQRVATLHDGILSSGRAHPFTLDAAGLADGTYIVRATAGETTVERRVTLVR